MRAFIKSFSSCGATIDSNISFLSTANVKKKTRKKKTQQQQKNTTTTKKHYKLPL